MRSALRHEGAKERILNQGNPDVLFRVEKRSAKSGRNDSNDGERMLVQINGTSGDLRICSEATAPQIFAQKRHGRCTLLAVRGGKDAPRQWLHIQKGKKLRRHDGRVDNRRL